MKNNLMVRKSIDVNENNYIPVANFKQEDDGVIKLALFANSTQIDCTGQTAKLYVTRPDSAVIELTTGCSINGNEVDITLKNNILAVPGIAECDLELIDAQGKMTTASFFIGVLKKMAGSENIEANNDISAINKIVEEVLAKGEKLNGDIDKIVAEANSKIAEIDKALKDKLDEMQADYDSLQKIIIDENQAANLQSQINKTNSQLDSIVQDTNSKFSGVENKKADKTEVRKNTVPLTLNDCDNTMINAIQGGGSTNFNLLSIPRNKSVDYSKTDFMKVISNNLVDMNKVTVGQTISGSTGGNYPSASTNVLGYFPVEPNTKYTLKYVTNYGFYKADQSFISSVSNSALDTPFTITTPAECYYVRLVYYPAKPLVQMNLGETLLVYDTYKLGLGDNVEQLTTIQKSDINNIPLINDRVNSVLGSTITEPVLESELTIVNGTFTLNNEIFTLQRGTGQYAWLYKLNSPSKARYKVKSGDVNLVLVANGTECVYLVYSGANAGRVLKPTTSVAPQLLPKFDDVTPYTVADGDELYITYENYKVVIQIKRVGTSSFVPYMTRDLISVKTQIDTVGKRELGFATLVTGAIYNLEYGFTETIEERTDILYKKYLDGELGSGGGGTTPPITNDDFVNDIWTAMGDSITAWDSTQSPVFGTNYRDLVKAKLNIGTVNNRGIGSTQIARKEGYEFDNLSFVNRWKNNTPTNSTIITVWGGTNDYFGAGNDGVPLGDSATTNKDVYTFYGALRVLIEGMVTSFPDRKIGFFTPMFRVNCTQPNQQGHILKDYADAIIKVCEEYGIPVLDLYRISGINANNHVTLLADGLHPKGLGHQFISRKIAKFIDRL